MEDYKLNYEFRTINSADETYLPLSKSGLSVSSAPESTDAIKSVFRITLSNTTQTDFTGIIHIKITAPLKNPK